MAPPEASRPHPLPGSRPALGQGWSGPLQGTGDSAGCQVRGGGARGTRGDTPPAALRKLHRGHWGQLSRGPACGQRSPPNGAQGSPALAPPAAEPPAGRGQRAARLGGQGGQGPGWAARGAGHSPLPVGSQPRRARGARGLAGRWERGRRPGSGGRGDEPERGRSGGHGPAGARGPPPPPPASGPRPAPGGRCRRGPPRPPAPRARPQPGTPGARPPGSSAPPRGGGRGKVWAVAWQELRGEPLAGQGLGSPRVALHPRQRGGKGRQGSVLYRDPAEPLLPRLRGGVARGGLQSPHSLPPPGRGPRHRQYSSPVTPVTPRDKGWMARLPGVDVWLLCPLTHLCTLFLGMNRGCSLREPPG